MIDEKPPKIDGNPVSSTFIPIIRSILSPSNTIQGSLEEILQTRMTTNFKDVKDKIKI